MKTIETTITGHKVVSREDWIAARKELLTKEKESTRLRDQLSAERRKLPWVKVFTMGWVRHHDRYGTDEFADANKPYWPATASPSSTTG
jgi:predicted dithiol-disulfide oxidoreductase (DUF899 family)